MVFVLLAPQARWIDDASYAKFRESGSQTATMFNTFGACNDAKGVVYVNVMKDLGIDKDDVLWSDKPVPTATCVRAY